MPLNGIYDMANKMITSHHVRVYTNFLTVILVVDLK